MRHIPRVMVLLIAVAFLAVAADAEWYTFQGMFGGNVTQLSSTNPRVGLQRARHRRGWLYKDGEMQTASFERLGHGGDAAAPIRWMHYYGNTRELVLFDNNIHAYSLDADASQSLYDTLLTDTGFIPDGDSLVHRNARPDSARWMRIQTWNPWVGQFVLIDGVPYPVLQWLSDSLIRLRGTYDAVGDTDIVIIQTPFPMNLASRTSSFVDDDTLWIGDGLRLIPYYGLGYNQLTLPEPNYFGTYDSVSTIDTTTSCYVYGDFAAGITGDHVMFEDSLGRGRVYIVGSLLDDGAANERLKVRADTSVWLSEKHFMDSAAGHYVSFLWSNQGYAPVSYLGTYEFEWLQDSIQLADATVNRGLLRSVSGTLCPICSLGAPGTDGIVIRSKSSYRQFFIDSISGDSCFAMMIDGSGPGQIGDTAGAVRSYPFYANGRFGWAGDVGGQDTMSYDILSLHRDRLYKLGNKEFPLLLSYSKIDTLREEEGVEPIAGQGKGTALRSLGPQIAIMMENRIEVLTGYTEYDFYKVKLPAGISVPVHTAIARNPRNNADYFPTRKGLFAFDGSQIREIPTQALDVFTDSINWTYPEALCAIIWDGYFWMGAPFGTSAVNNRMIAIELETGALSFFDQVNPGCMIIVDEGAEKERMFVGDADSNIVWELQTGTADRVAWADYRSGFYDFGDASTIWEILEFWISYEGVIGDSIVVDFYANEYDSVLWADTLELDATGPNVWLAWTGLGVAGKTIGIGVRSNAADLRIVDFGLNPIARGRGVRD